MQKVVPNKPFLLMLYGFPGSGKTYFARQFCEHVQAAHVQADRIRYELFEQPRYDKQENSVVLQIVDYMVEEFLQAGVSVVYDMNVLRVAQRQHLRQLAHKAHAQPILVWQQIDADSALNRAMKRDRRKADDRYAMQPDYTTFQRIAGAMQNPQTTEPYVVTSGKHLFNTQLSAVMKQFYQLGLVSGSTANEKVVKPGLVNLVPHQQPGRNPSDRRNIFIR